MFHVRGTADLLRVVTSSAADIEVHVDWVEYTDGASTVTPGNGNFAISSATTTTLVTSPGAAATRSIQSLTVKNAHASLANTVTVVHTDGSVVSDVATATLAAGESLQYHGGSAPAVLDVQGRVKQNTINTDGVVAAALLSGPLVIDLMKTGSAAKAAANQQSFWLSNPSAGAAPPAYTAGSGYACSKATTGALPLVNASVGSNRIAMVVAGANVAGGLILYDRLWSCGGMGFAAATYTVTTPGSLPARVTDNGLGCEVFVEQFVAAGAASGTLTINYVNAAGSNVSAVIPAVVSAPVVGQIQRFPINDGIRSVTSVVNSATWTSGSWGITIARRLLDIPVTLANVQGPPLDWTRTALRVVPADACLMLAAMPTATTAMITTGSMTLVDL